MVRTQAIIVQKHVTLKTVVESVAPRAWRMENCSVHSVKMKVWLGISMSVMQFVDYIHRKLERDMNLG